MQPTPVFLPGESQGWGSLVGCCLWGRTELDTTEATQQQQQPVFLPGESYGQRSLVGFSPWGHKESDTTERLSTQYLIREVKKFSQSQIILLLITELLIYCWNLFESSSGPG